MARPLVSLVVPVYNAEKYLSMTLDSIRMQTLLDFECIIVNDCSPDQSKQVIDAYLKKDKRFKLVTHRGNGGLSAARNSGLRFAKGKYVAFLDADDLIMPDSLLLRSKTLEASDDPRVIGTYAGSVSIPNDCRLPPEGKDIKLKIVDFITAGGNCPFNANQPMFKTELFRKIGGFDESLKQAEDYDMWIRVLRKGYRIIPTEKQLVTYRQTPGSMIKENPLLHLDTSLARYSQCFNQLKHEQIDDRFEINLSKATSEYLQEMNIANRVLEFSGIALAKGDYIGAILDRLIKYLPNYFQIIESHRNFRKEIQKGINRYFGRNIDLGVQENLHLAQKVERLYDLFKKQSEFSNCQPLRSCNIDQLDNLLISRDSIVSNVAVQEKIDILFFPHKDYHVYTISLLQPYLRKLGISALIVDISYHYRDEGVRVACEKYSLPFIGYGNFLLGNFKPKSIIVFNDWDPIVQSIVFAARKSGIKTIGIVEGIQDYLDADTKQDRKAYQSVEYLFLPGEYDKRYFVNTNQELFVGGIPRIFDLYQRQQEQGGKKNINAQTKIALINSNFSYGVLEEFRDEWLTMAVKACQEQGFAIVISRHPADKGQLFPELVTEKSFYDALSECDVYISRFASGILESLAVGILPVYFNPHNEQVDKFKEPKGAYPIACTTEELKEVLGSLEIYYGKCAVNFNDFLCNHSGNLNLDPAQSIAEKVSEIISGNYYDVKMDIFSKQMQDFDGLSGSFNNISALRKYLKDNREVFNLSTREAVLKSQDKEISVLIQKGLYKEALKGIESMEYRSRALSEIKRSLEFLVQHVR